MVAQVTLLSTPLPNSREQTADEFEGSVATFVSELNPLAVGMNAVAAEVNTNALNAAAAADGLANSIWVTGTTYAIGDVRYSSVDYFNYRRKTAGAGSTDPSADTTNWVLLTKTSNGSSDTTSSAVDLVLTSSSNRLQIISMTAAAKKTTLPSATTLQKGTSIFVIKNNGFYRFAVHKNGGLFICYVQPGQVISFSCSDISTAAGIWHVGGQGIETIYSGATAEVLNAVDSRNIAVAMLSTTKAICVFRNNATGYLWGVILNYGSASGTPAAINAEASDDISIAAQTSTQATVLYRTSSGITKGYVLDVSTNTITPGTVATIDGTASGGGADIAVLSSTKLLCAYMDSSLDERVLDIAASAITASTNVVVDSSALSNTNVRCEAISATKAIIGVRASSGGDIRLRLQSITGSTPAATGSVMTITDSGTSPLSGFEIVVMSTTRALVMQPIDRAYSDILISLIDISGTTPVLIRKRTIHVGSVSDLIISANKLTANKVYVSWIGGDSLGVDAMIVTMTEGDQIIVGELSPLLEAGVTATQGYMSCAVLDSTHVMQVCRNASTFLSAKTVELGS